MPARKAILRQPHRQFEPFARAGIIDALACSLLCVRNQPGGAKCGQELVCTAEQVVEGPPRLAEIACREATNGPAISVDIACIAAWSNRQQTRRRHGVQRINAALIRPPLDTGSKLSGKLCTPASRGQWAAVVSLPPTHSCARESAPR